MKRKMTYVTRAELANAIRGRYGAAGGKDKRRILEEFIAATGYHEKSAIRVLNSAPAWKRGASKCAPLQTGMSHFPATWKWTWSLIAGR